MPRVAFCFSCTCEKLVFASHHEHNQLPNYLTDLHRKSYVIQNSGDSLAIIIISSQKNAGVGILSTDGIKRVSCLPFVTMNRGDQKR
jgi:hypothetical protein